MLNGRQQKFAEEYLKDFNATKAAQRAGYSNNTAYSQGHRLLKDDEIIEYIETRKDEIFRQYQVSEENLLAELAKIGFSNIADFVEWGHEGINLIDSEGLRRDQTAGILEVSETGPTRKIKLQNKTGALETLLRHIKTSKKVSNEGGAPPLLLIFHRSGEMKDVIPRSDNGIILQFTPRQTEWFEMLGEANELFVGGAAGPGKSHWLRAISIVLAYYIPGITVGLFRRKWQELIDNHIDSKKGYPILLNPLVESGHVKWNEQKKTFYFWNGSKVGLRQCQYEKDWTKHLGSEYDVLLFDELTTFTEKIFRGLRSRTRSVGIKIPDFMRSLLPCIELPIVAAGSNPGNVGHTWVKRTFVDVSPEGQVVEMPEEEGGMRRAFCRALMEDNPYLMADDPTYGSRLNGLGNPNLVNAMRRGEWDIDAGGMFGDLWERSVHILEPFEIPSSWYVDRSHDWGSVKPAATGWWAESDGCEVELANGKRITFPRGSLFLIQEHYTWNGTPNEGIKLTSGEVADEVLKRDKQIADRYQLRVHPGPADSAIWNQDERDSSIALKMERKGLYWEKAVKGPGSRINGWEIMRNLLKASLALMKTGYSDEPCLFVFSHCLQWIRTTPGLPRCEVNPEDVDTNAEDHHADQTRYRITKARQVGRKVRMRL